VRYEQRGMGGLRRLTVAVVVNYKRIVGKDGKVTVKAYTPEEMGKINDLVKQAMGYNQDRGDAVSVANAPFEGVDRPYEQPPEWWRDPANLPLAKDFAKFLITAMILLYIVLRIVKPMMRPVFKKIDEFNAVEPEPESRNRKRKKWWTKVRTKRSSPKKSCASWKKTRYAATAKTWPWRRNWRPKTHASWPTSSRNG
jgi:flagellar biosynthesis/type III secretory pathway M-ring protein FliF/YscJ